MTSTSKFNVSSTQSTTKKTRRPEQVDYGIYLGDVCVATDTEQDNVWLVIDLAYNLHVEMFGVAPTTGKHTAVTHFWVKHKGSFHKVESVVDPSLPVDHIEIGLLTVKRKESTRTSSK